MPRRKLYPKLTVPEFERRIGYFRDSRDAVSLAAHYVVIMGRSVNEASFEFRVPAQTIRATLDRLYQPHCSECGQPLTLGPNSRRRIHSYAEHWHHKMQNIGGKQPA
jgi:hypothetical protein